MKATKLTMAPLPAPQPSGGAPDAPLSPFAHRLAVLKRYRRRVNGEKRKARKMTAAYIQTVEFILRDIINGADLLAEGTIQVGEREWNREKAVFLLVRMSPRHFADLCVMGAELEDDEEECEDEGAQCEDEGANDEDWEPSLGSQDAVMDQTHWGEPADTWPWQITDGEPNGDEEPSPLPPEKVKAARARVCERVAAGKPEDGPDAIRNGAGFVVLKRDRWGVSRWWTEEERRAARARGDTP